MLSNSMLTRVLSLAIGLISFTATAQAQVLSIPEGTEGLSAIAGKITGVEQRRIPLGDAVTGSETRVNLQFNLAGCVDKLMPLITYSQIKGQRVTFYVTALNAHHPLSQLTNCAMPHQASAQVSVPGVFSRNQIKVVFLGQPQPQTVTPQN